MILPTPHPNPCYVSTLKLCCDSPLSWPRGGGTRSYTRQAGRCSESLGTPYQHWYSIGPRTRNAYSEEGFGKASNRFVNLSLTNLENRLLDTVGFNVTLAAEPDFSIQISCPHPKVSLAFLQVSLALL